MGVGGPTRSSPGAWWKAWEVRMSKSERMRGWSWSGILSVRL